MIIEAHGISWIKTYEIKFLKANLNKEMKMKKNLIKSYDALTCSHF